MTRLLLTSGDAWAPWAAPASAVDEVEVDADVVALSRLAGPAAVRLGGDAVGFAAALDVHSVVGGDDFPVDVKVAAIETVACTFFVNAVSVSAMSGVTLDWTGTAAMIGAAVVRATVAVRSTTFVKGGPTAVGAADTTASTVDVASFAVCVTGAVAAVAACVTGAVVVGVGTGLEAWTPVGVPVVLGTACSTACSTGGAAVCTGAGALDAGALGIEAPVVPATGCVAAVRVGAAGVPGSSARATPASAAKQARTPATRIDRIRNLARVDTLFLFPVSGHMSRKTGFGSSEKGVICGQATPVARPVWRL
jgi:hypothetical protein